VLLQTAELIPLSPISFNNSSLASQSPFPQAASSEEGHISHPSRAAAGRGGREQSSAISLRSFVLQKQKQVHQLTKIPDFEVQEEVF